MPNNTTNILVIYNEDSDLNLINKVLTMSELGDLVFDFNKIIPMPPELNVESSSRGNEAYACLHGTDEDLKYYFDMDWVDNYITSREDLTTFLEKRSPKLDTDELSWRQMGDRYESNMTKYGHKTWYSWCCDKWGTKWNSYNMGVISECDPFEITFETAWSAPTPIYEALQEMFPELTIEAFWSDEGRRERSQVF